MKCSTACQSGDFLIAQSCLLNRVCAGMRECEAEFGPISSVLVPLKPFHLYT